MTNDDMVGVTSLVLFVGFVAWARKRRRGRSRGTCSRDQLDRTFLRIEPGVELTLRNLDNCILALGAIGSGKTTGVLAAILRGLVGHGGMLYLAAKPGDRADLMKLIARRGRRADVLVLDDTAGSHRLNFFDTILRVDADLATKAQLAATGFDQFHQVSRRSQGQGWGEDGRFWEQAYARMVKSVILLLLMAGEKVTPAAILRVIMSFPTSPDQMASAGWKAGYCNRCLRSAYQHAEKTGAKAEFEAVSDYVLAEIPGLSDKTRSGVVAMVTGTCDSLLTGLGARLFSGESTFDLRAAIAAGKIVIVDLPYGRWGDVGRAIAAGAKFLVQLEGMRRRVHPWTRPFAIVADEYQNILTSDDWQYVSMCRSFRVPMVIATQGVESLQALLDGETGKAKIDSLVGNIGTTFITLPTPNTATWVIDRLGRVKTTTFGGSTSSGGGYRSPYDFVFPGPDQTSASVNEVFETALHHSDLQNFRTGGPACGWAVDALMLQPGQGPGRSTPFRFVTFYQET